MTIVSRLGRATVRRLLIRNVPHRRHGLITVRLDRNLDDRFTAGHLTSYVRRDLRGFVRTYLHYLLGRNILCLGFGRGLRGYCFRFTGVRWGESGPGGGSGC